jgi:hypothetical protein
LLNGKEWQKKKNCHRMPLSEHSERMPLNAILPRAQWNENIKGKQITKTIKHNTL